MVIRAKQIERFARATFPPAPARFAKRFAVWPRYWWQARACRRGYERFGERYPQTVLFIAGLPKSGTTWLKKMVGHYPGFHELLIPDATAYELATGGSHDYELPSDTFERFERMLVLTKMHIGASPNNLRLLDEAGVHYVILFRDLRDIAISHFYYVRNTPWHPEHPIYRRLDLQTGLRVFAERTLSPYVEWVRSWLTNRDPARSIVLRYEQMLDDPHDCLTEVARLFQLDASPETVGRIVAAHDFKQMSGGRERGQVGETEFVRKGVAGDWVCHFTPELCALYDEKIGDLPIEFGFEPDYRR